MKTYALALWWWAARWLAHVWILKYLEEQNIKINELAGTSMWAIIATFVALWKTSKEIEEILISLSFFKLIDLDLKTGLIKGKKIEKKFQERFGKTRIEETLIPLKIVATNIETGTSKIFTKGEIVEALRASISIPGIFIPKKIQQESYIDGWVMMNLPIEALTGKNIIAVSALKINLGKIEKTKKIIWIHFKSWFFQNNYEIIKRSILLMMKTNEEKSLTTPHKNISFIRPDFWKLDILDFNKGKEFIQIGYESIEQIKL